MAEWIAVDDQTINGGADVAFSTMTVPTTNCSIVHRNGSGIFTLRGITKGQCRARYRVTFQGNIAIPTGGTVGEISLSLAIDGEPQNAYLMASTPTAVESFDNVGVTTSVDVVAGCCANVSVQNTSFSEEGAAIPITVRNASILIDRIA